MMATTEYVVLCGVAVPCGGLFAGVERGASGECAGATSCCARADRESDGCVSCPPRSERIWSRLRACAAGSSHYTRTPYGSSRERGRALVCATRRRRMGEKRRPAPCLARGRPGHRAHFTRRCVYQSTVLGVVCGRVQVCVSVERVCGCAPDARPWVSGTVRVAVSRVWPRLAPGPRSARAAARSPPRRAAAPRPETDARWKESRGIDTGEECRNMNLVPQEAPSTASPSARAGAGRRPRADLCRHLSFLCPHIHERAHTATTIFILTPTYRSLRYPL